MTRFMRHRVETDVEHEAMLTINTQVGEKSGALWYSIEDSPLGQVEVVVYWPIDERVARFVRDVARQGISV